MVIFIRVIRRNSLIIKVIAIYQILIWGYVSIRFSIHLINLIALHIDLSVISDAITIGISLVMIYSSIFLIAASKHFRFCLAVNKWSNFIQIFQLSLMGFNFFIIVGFHIVLYYFYDETQFIGASYDLFRYSLEFNYKPQNNIQAGISLVPFVIYLILNKLEKTEIESSVNKLVDNMEI